MSETTVPDFIEELRWRGLLHQCTDEEALRKHLSTPGRKAYSGFDPTADSLTIGNLVPMMVLVHFQRAGHVPVVVMGGGTGLIGDPSGKSDERQLRTGEEIAANVEAQKKIFERVFSAENGLETPEIENNLKWLGGLGYIEALRDVGKHFSVNMMMQKDSVRDRLQNREQGMSYTEFSYMILQSYDFRRLYEDTGVTLQVGGSDQWGNIVAGIDLVKKAGKVVCAHLENLRYMLVNYPGSQEEDEAYLNMFKELAGNYLTAGLFQEHDAKCPLEEVLNDVHTMLFSGPKVNLPRTEWTAYGLTAPLITKADGGKFGKTEAGAIWLSADRTSPYALYQWCMNTADADVVRFLKIFTMLDEPTIKSIEKEHKKVPGKRVAQTRLAEEFVKLLHGTAALAGAQAASKALFSGDVSGLDERTLAEVFAETPSTELPVARAEGMAMLEALTETGLAKSNREAKEFLAGGSVSVNGEKVGADRTLGTADFLPGRVTLLRRGKKAWHVVRWV